MKKRLVHNPGKWLSLLLVSLYLTVSLAGVVLAGPNDPVDPGSGSSSSGTTITQPPIIPTGATATQKLYIPHNTSQESNKNYLENRLLPGIASSIIGLTGALALLFAIVSGIQLLTSYGNADAGNKAKTTLTYSLIGVIIAGLSYAIVKIVASINF
jgi:hypothetical protein